jgi:sulfide:quinone oxidoreductase
MADILIIGGGFAGLVTAERLSGSLGANDRITLVSPTPRFTFYPALVHVAFGRLTPDDITFDLGNKLSEMGVRFIQAEMLCIDSERKMVEVTGPDIDGEISFDYLVIASGRRLATEKISGFFEYSHHLLGINPALRFGEAVRDFSSGTIILGLCPESRLPVPVCETAFALANKFEKQMMEGSVHLKVVFPESLDNAFGGANLHKEVEAAFKKRGITVHYDVPVCEITKEAVLSNTGHEIKYDLLMLLPPFRGKALLAINGITDDSDFVKVNGKMQVNGMKNVYAAGDIVAFSGPKLAHMAVRQAEVVAENIIWELLGKEPEAEYYHEISTVIDAGAQSVYLHYGIWDDALYGLHKGKVWGWAKEVHDKFWRMKHKASKSI